MTHSHMHSTPYLWYWILVKLATDLQQWQIAKYLSPHDVNNATHLAVVCCEAQALASACGIRDNTPPCSNVSLYDVSHGIADKKRSPDPDYEVGQDVKH